MWPYNLVNPINPCASICFIISIDIMPQCLLNVQWTTTVAAIMTNSITVVRTLNMLIAPSQHRFSSLLLTELGSLSQSRNKNVTACLLVHYTRYTRTIHCNVCHIPETYHVTLNHKLAIWWMSDLPRTVTQNFANLNSYMNVGWTLTRMGIRGTAVVRFCISWPGVVWCDIRKRIAIARNCMASLDRNIWHSSLSLPQSYDSIESSYFLSSSMELKHGPIQGNWRGIWMLSTSGVYVVY